MFQQNNRIFVKTLIQKYAPDTPAEIIAYIDTNLNECFPETLLEELDDLIGAPSEMRFRKLQIRTHT